MEISTHFSGSYILNGGASLGLLANSSYYFGSFPHLSINNKIPSIRRIIIPKSGIIVTIALFFKMIRLPSSEISKLYLLLNNTIEHLVLEDVNLDTDPSTFLINDLNILVTAGDYIEFKWVTPIWVIRPKVLSINSTILINY